MPTSGVRRGLMRVFWFLTALWEVPVLLLVVGSWLMEPSYFTAARIVGLVGWAVIPPGLLYLAGHTVAWLIRGFEEPRSSPPRTP